MSESRSVASSVCGRAVSKLDLKKLQSPEEGGTKKEYEDVLNNRESCVNKLGVRARHILHRQA